ncbi:MAG: tetratricopeptide repeat protein [Sandaracinaceae bacterium]|nr:tetratricopeptide repeat protein [Sandaracinaceae bacterium]
MDERTKQLLSLGREHYDKREFDKAEHYLRQILERNDKFADVYNMLGVIHHDRGRLEEAQGCFEEALSINPNYTEAALNLAVTYNDLGRYDEAKKIYRAALSRGEESPGQLDPFVKGKIANLHAEVAQAYTDAGMASEAMHELRKAVLLCPTFADLRLRLANLYRQMGDLEAARFELEEAIAARAQFVPAHVSLGVVLLALGDKNAAVTRWRSALAIDPDNKAAQMYLRMTERVDDSGSMRPGPPGEEGEG